MNRGWLFSPRYSADAMKPGFDESSMTTVTLPHANLLLPWHSFDERSYQFVSVYRRHFRTPDDLQAKRVFVDFEGAMTASTVTINGHEFEEYKGGYTPFSVEITPYLDPSGSNLLSVKLDSTERADIPPFGGNIDYLTFGGIYREVALRIVPKTYIENVFAMPVEVLTTQRKLVVRCHLAGDAAANGKLAVELRDGDRVLQRAEKTNVSAIGLQELTLNDPGNIELWSLQKPKLYTVVVEYSSAQGTVDQFVVRTGFREARFTPDGFYLNGTHLKLRGLNRHQTYPYVGGAMPARVQGRDAQILKNELKLNLVRTSHYPQSRHFLDACDELGLLVLEEIPGWQHIGENAWQDLSVRNVDAMVRRDWNHPSIILWGVRINESQDNHPFYVRTNQVAHELDPSRQTGGIRYLYDSELLEDVFTMNDFGFPLRPPNHPLYLNTEFCGHTYSTKRIDQVERVAEHAMRHARVHNQLASDKRYAGGIGWCAFDYNTHSNFGSGDHICYHGVSDIFRIPKAAAGFYKSQCDPADEIVLEPAFSWSSGDHSGAGGPGIVPVCSNCDHLKLYIDGKLHGEADPDRETYGHLPHPPFLVNLSDLPLNPWGDLRIEGYLRGKQVTTKTYSGKGIDAKLVLELDDTELVGDGIDTTRLVFRVTDEYGNTQQFSSGVIELSVEGEGEIIGENSFGLVGGAGAVWIKSKPRAGTIRVTAKHPFLGVQQKEIRVSAAMPEAI
jgi:beta-galactosidase